MSSRKKILSTDLILNSDGSIYHLNLFPDEIADFIILVGDPNRVSVVSDFFDQIEIKKANREFITHTGHIGNRRISCVSTGIGCGAIDIVLNELDALANIDFKHRRIKSTIKKLKLLRLGTTGSLQKEIDINSLIFTEYAFSFDGLMKYYATNLDKDENALLKEIKKQFKKLPTIDGAYVTRVSEKMSHLFCDIKQKGITMTCVGFFGPQHRHLRAPLISENIFEMTNNLEYRNFSVTNLEMETAAIFGLAKLLGHDYGSISMVAANRVSREFTKDLEGGIKNMIERTFEMLD